jgi:DNA-binding transcriptional LysR family regulator
MELRQLRFFVAAAEELHFGRAAKRLHVSQPALSFEIRKFEEQLGVQLLARTNKNVALTNSGQVLLSEARNLLQQAAEAERLTVRSAQGLAGRLRVGFVNSMLYRGLSEAVKRFEADHPALEIVLTEMNTNEQVPAIQRMQIDVGCAYWCDLPTGVVSVPIVTEPFVCCLPEHHRLASNKIIDLRKLSRDDFILFPRQVSPHYHDLIIALCVEAGFSPRIRHEVRLWQTVVTMVGRAMGIALVPQALRSSQDKGVVFRPMKSNRLVSDVLALKRGDQPEPGPALFIDYVKEAALRAAT